MQLNPHNKKNQPTASVDMYICHGKSWSQNADGAYVSHNNRGCSALCTVQALSSMALTSLVIMIQPSSQPMPSFLNAFIEKQ